MDDNKDKQDVTKKAGILAKLKSIKHLNLIVALAAAAVCVLVYFTFFAGGGDEASADSSEDLENKIASVLSRIEGVGDCEVVITYDGEGEKEIAYEEESESNITTDSDGSGDRTVENSASSSKPVIVTIDGQQQVLVISESPAPVKGVVVVAKGGDDIYVKLKIIDAVCALLDVEGLNVKVFGMK